MQSQVLNRSSLVREDGTFRLDAEHYHQQFLNNREKLVRFGSVPLSDLISQPVITGHTPSMKVESNYGGDIKFVKTDNLRAFRISGTFSHFLSLAGNAQIKRSSLVAGDVIITIIGATHKIVGRTAIVREDDLPANINQNIALIRLRDFQSPQFLSAYLNSKTGRLALWQLSRQTEQVNLNCREVEKVLIPCFSDELILEIENTYNEGVACDHLSRLAFKNAREYLLQEIGLVNWPPKHRPSFIRSFSEVSASK